MKLDEAKKTKKKLQNMIKLNVNEISRWRYKSTEQKNALENVKLLYKSWETVI